MKNATLKLTAFYVAVCLTSSATAASILTNGSFEDYNGTGFNSNIGAGFIDWSIGGGGIDLVVYGMEPGHWIAQDGNVSISLNWNGPGSISQSVTTTTGQLYAISFHMGAELNGGSVLRTMNVLWNGNVVGTPSFEFTGQPITAMGWQQFSFVVQGTGSDTLSFASTTGANYGPALDNVAVTLVPEPTTTVSVIFGILGFSLLRGRHK